MRNTANFTNVHTFILQAIDPYFGCPIIEIMIYITDLHEFRSIIRADILEDPEFRAKYNLSKADLLTVCDKYNVQLEPSGREYCIVRSNAIRDIPYLVHTGYELFLMLEGLKPLAIFTVEYPGEATDFPEGVLFEPHVQSGTLIKRVMANEPFEKPIKTASGRIFEGVRQIFYARNGEEWRIEAYNLIWKQAVSGTWNDTLERLQGSLLGYTDEQNDWWIAHRKQLRF